MLKIDDIKAFIEYVKVLKPENIFVYQGKVYSVDDSISYIRSLENVYPLKMVSLVEQKLFRYSDLVSLFKELTEANLDLDIEVNDNYIFNILKVPIKKGYNTEIINSINNCIIFRNTPTAIYNNIQTDSKFLECVNVKSADGTKMFILDNKYVIGLFSGVVSMNKNDKVDIHIMDMGMTFIATFYVKKAKGVVVASSFRFGKV